MKLRTISVCMAVLAALTFSSCSNNEPEAKTAPSAPVAPAPDTEAVQPEPLEDTGPLAGLEAVAFAQLNDCRNSLASIDARPLITAANSATSGYDFKPLATPGGDQCEWGWGGSSLKVIGGTLDANPLLSTGQLDYELNAGEALDARSYSAAWTGYRSLTYLAVNDEGRALTCVWSQADADSLNGDRVMKPKQADALVAPVCEAILASVQS